MHSKFTVFYLKKTKQKKVNYLFSILILRTKLLAGSRGVYAQFQIELQSKWSNSPPDFSLTHCIGSVSLCRSYPERTGYLERVVSEHIQGKLIRGGKMRKEKVHKQPEVKENKIKVTENENYTSMRSQCGHSTNDVVTCDGMDGWMPLKEPHNLNWLPFDLFYLFRSPKIFQNKKVFLQNKTKNSRLHSVPLEVNTVSFNQNPHLHGWTNAINTIGWFSLITDDKDFHIPFRIKTFIKNFKDPKSLTNFCRSNSSIFTFLYFSCRISLAYPRAAWKDKQPNLTLENIRDNEENQCYMLTLGECAQLFSVAASCVPAF